MQITNADIIKNGEQDLIDAITADLDWEAIENIFREQHNLGIDEDVEYKQGDIVVYDNQIAYQLQFEVKVTVSVLLDRDGNYLKVAFSGNNQTEAGESDELRKDQNDESADDVKEDILGLSEKQDTPQGTDNKVKTTEEDIEELEALAENEEYDDSEIIDTEVIDEGIEKNKVDAEQKDIYEPQQTIPDKIVKEDIEDTKKEVSEQKISRIASQVGEIMAELGEGINAQK
jgi:hypothetical protein